MKSYTPDRHIETALTEQHAKELDIIELFFFAYRDFTADPDMILEKLTFGRAHHRVLYFVNRKPGMTVAELLEVLKITKQSLARVLKQLIDTGHIVQIQGPRDGGSANSTPRIRGVSLHLNWQHRNHAALPMHWNSSIQATGR